MNRMDKNAAPDSSWRFVSFGDAEVEPMPGRTHHWYCKPGLMKDTDLLMVRVHFPPGGSHKFHYHPKMEEILYVLSGTAEQWVDKEKRILGPGDSLYLEAGVVHGTYNTGDEPLELLAILGQAKSEGPGVVDVFDEEPWNSLRPD
ncbi:MAG: cupin domain-containing protein [Opitutales bacterium]